MGTHNFKCVCKEKCGRILVIDDEMNVARLDDFVLGFSEEFPASTIDTSSESLMLGRGWTMLIKPQTLPHLREVVEACEHARVAQSAEHSV